jgi:hypothetical protein
MTDNTRMQDQTFGIEIETVGASRKALAEAVAKTVGGTPERRGADDWRIKADDGRTWNVVRDGSLPGIKSGEVVTPILTYEDLGILGSLTANLRKAGAETDEHTGLHIHVGVQGITGDALANLAKIVALQEPYILMALGTSQRRTDEYCRPVDEEFLGRLQASKGKLDTDKFFAIWYGTCDADHRKEHHYDKSRYHGLNLHSVAYRGTAEYRYFNGTLDAVRIKSYVQFCLALTAKGRNASHARLGKREYQAGSARYDLRVFLIRLGLNGAEFADCRKTLTAGLPGDCAFKHGRPA